MYEFTFGAALALIVVWIGVHNYYSDKIKNKIEDAWDRYFKTNVDAYVRGGKEISTKHVSLTNDVWEEYGKLIYDLLKTQREARDLVTESENLQNLFYDALKTMFVSIILFITAGLLPFLELQAYFLPSLISASIFLIIALWFIYRVMSRI